MTSGSPDKNEQCTEEQGKSYGTIVVESGGHAILGDDIRALHRAITDRQPDASSSSEREKVLTQLETLARVLQQAEQLEVGIDSVSRGRAETLHALATSTSLTLKDFLGKVEDLDRFDPNTGEDERVRESSKRTELAPWELRKLQQYLTVQMLCINGMLSCMQ
ncbi:hypothetical protein LTR70_006536 [Exophiala xenobiotica]|uniref:Uncharacterized protein n=1 Tax=Lithohypha guttulata TaxID=1690604 RepID=A0ABR0K7E2_9EURO|nr:hypothetical protein LTR24_006023 [Lithohypha guttulata]KAK5315894.1 hypothetical protein LTR70_006536 [Exophiala xenobiotica]